MSLDGGRMFLGAIKKKILIWTTKFYVTSLEHVMCVSDHWRSKWQNILVSVITRPKQMSINVDVMCTIRWWSITEEQYACLHK